MSQIVLKRTLTLLCGRFGKLGLLMLSLSMLVLSSGASGWAAGKSEMDTLTKGQVVVSQDTEPSNAMPSVEAKILISKSQDKVWSVVANPEKLMREEKKVKKVKVLSRAGNKQNVEFSVLMTRLLPPFNYILLQELSAPGLLRFHRISGSFKDIQGSWRLTPIENGSKTILTYTLKIDPGPFLPIPRWMLLNAVKSDLPGMMMNVKASIDKG